MGLAEAAQLEKPKHLLPSPASFEKTHLEVAEARWGLSNLTLPQKRPHLYMGKETGMTYGYSNP